MKLPTWLEANRNVANKTANPIDVFINNNEPAGLESEEKFREELEKMLEYVRLLTQPAPDGACTCAKPSWVHDDGFTFYCSVCGKPPHR